MPERLPTFTRCADGKFYEDLVYSDDPTRRAWFLCFSDVEPAELVIREDLIQGDIGPRTILRARGFFLRPCLSNIVLARKPHTRYFGVERNAITGRETPVEPHSAVSFYLSFKKGVPLPTPNAHDSCVEIYPYFPNKPGVYFGDQR